MHAGVKRLYSTYVSESEKPAPGDPSRSRADVYGVCGISHFTKVVNKRFVNQPGAHGNTPVSLAKHKSVGKCTTCQDLSKKEESPDAAVRAEAGPGWVRHEADVGTERSYLDYLWALALAGLMCCVMLDKVDHCKVRPSPQHCCLAPHAGHVLCSRPQRQHRCPYRHPCTAPAHTPPVLAAALAVGLAVVPAAALAVVRTVCVCV